MKTDSGKKEKTIEQQSRNHSGQVFNTEDGENTEDTEAFLGVRT